ncbi:MAG: metallophosphoesterase [Planctomycetes bacterium]|nr:metallophosphoesterase [Planctomycetota bacterium]
MKLYAISDLHVDYRVNREALDGLPHRPEDWLIVAGDIGPSEEPFHQVLALVTRRYARVLWTPGNHDLWTLPAGNGGLRGEAKYRKLVSICAEHGVSTPEDPFPTWPGGGGCCVLAPVFVLYDYSFRPDHVPVSQAVEWAKEAGVLCSDELLLHPDPYPSRSQWCDARCEYTEQRLSELPADSSVVLISHFPLREDLVSLPAIPRFCVWCGTRRTEDWHTRYRARVAVYGHLHRRSTSYRHGVRFEEVSLGYPRQWKPEQGIGRYLREILPGPGME